ncbi:MULTISPECIES: hypothetical protein [Prochlorococcus]|uniref:hypothetical protein n=1 Tax=Prochlorococcus TaxID=1218 RepID=UPI0007B3B670|nr:MULTISPECIES: hypothetical protein [Prochlorococcus]KZR67257.1 hypothetical protein PMIT1312_00548 [Prochlorococcus marinus str. MIT 1312]NMO83789.1 hypothetical protein [Prochlorococcus sp. P1344]NMP12436.1 hypothetical protein [Prochlorococcus sp.P1363]
MTKLTAGKVLKSLGLPAKGGFTFDLLQSACLEVAETAHRKDLFVGSCGSVVAAIAFCGQTVWSYHQALELTKGQRRVLKAEA